MKSDSMADDLARVFAEAEGGIVGKVDALFAACAASGVELDWRPDGIRARAGEGAWQEVPFVLARPSAYRAALARIAALCNERSPESVTPYGGTGELAVGSAVFRVEFSNTLAEQRLSLRPIAVQPARVPASGALAAS